MWDWTESITQFFLHTMKDREHAIATVQPIIQLPIHQSGVHCLTARWKTSYQTQSRERHCEILSGGDDAALHYVALSWDTVDTPLIRVLVHPSGVTHAHASAVQGVAFISHDKAISTSLDQRLNLWQWSHSWTLLEQLRIDVPDVSDLQVHHVTPTSLKIIIAGIGLQIIHCNFSK